MRLSISMAAAAEQLTAVINEGYRLRTRLEDDYAVKAAGKVFDVERDIARYEGAVGAWVRGVLETLAGIFPTELEANAFRTPQPRPAIQYVGISQRYGALADRCLELIHSLGDRRLRQEW